jgi:uncharacterized protein (DUF2252 family)
MAVASAAEQVSEIRPGGFNAKYLSMSERIALGKKARSRVPRSSHADYQPAPNRPDPVSLLERQAQTRVEDLVPIRHGRMLVSPFTFYRGAALIMASDLSNTPDSGLRVQCCGDAHLSNFGAFASAERRLIFDINDFDETLPGPWEWDVKRLAASMLIAARNNDFRPKDQEKIVQATAESYRTAMAEFASQSNLEVWYSHIELEPILKEYKSQFTPLGYKRAKANIAKAHTRDSMSAFRKLAHVVDGRAQIIHQPPLIVPVEQFSDLSRPDAVERLNTLMAHYRASLQHDRRALIDQFELQDFARKVVGVGSVGTRAFIVLMTDRDGQHPLFLQAKEAEKSVLEEFVGASEFECSGERVVVGQRMIQASSDIFLGWLRVQQSPVDQLQRDFYVRQLRDWKGSAEVERMFVPGMTLYGRLCGWTLARAHARTGDRVAIAAYLGQSNTFDKAIVEFSKAYAAQNQLDYKALSKAVKSGRVTAEMGY